MTVDGGEIRAEPDGAALLPGGTPVIAPAPSADWYPLSSGQLAMWLVHQRSAARGAYAVPAVYQLEGALDTDALRRAVEVLLSRHESLRTAIGEVAGVPMQRVLDQWSLDWRFEAVPDPGEVARSVRDFAARDFDLSSGQLVRVLLIERSTTDHVFVVSTHHVATDGWSVRVMVEEIASAYNSFVRGEPHSLRTPTLQYKDYSWWQQRLLAEGYEEESRQYWLAKLGGGPEPLDLPADRVRPAAQTFRGALASRTIGTESLDPLRALCREERVTLYSALSAVLRVQFFRYTGQQDFVLGTSSLGRAVPELHDKVGYYSNTLALRDTVAPGMRFREVFRAVQATLFEALEHADYPFDRVVRDAGASMAMNRNPLFDVMVLMDSGWGGPSVPMDGLAVRHLEAFNGHSKMDLTLFFKETAAGLEVKAEYSTDLFDAGRVDRLLEHFETLLTAAADQPDRAVETLRLLPDHERTQVLADFNDTDTDYQLDTPIHHLFEQWAQQTPHQVATVDDHHALTFAELNAKANALAWTLRDDHGVGPETLVALLMDRSVELMVAILGVLKAGGAFLPISRSDPAPRVDAILRDSGSTVVVVRGSGTSTFRGGGRSAVDVCLADSPSRRLDNPPPLATPDHAVYCIYTSGSTGEPNGVLIEHRAVVNRLRWMVDELGLDETDVILQKTPYVFDVSIWELLLPGMIGASQVMLRPGAESDPVAIRDAIDRHGVTTTHFVPSMLSQYLAAEADGFRGVRRCICSGEELGADLAHRFFAATRDSSTRLYNYYGPTEATVDVTSARVEQGPDQVSIGRPAANNRVYVLGAADEPCPVGVTGELCISGVQVGRGYLGRPELTAARFADDPFRPGYRMYRTGDLARWRTDGTISYLGRRDNQVKIRGFRIELGEIEQALRNQPGVEAAVVVPQRDATGADFLCAYLAGAVCPPAHRLRDALAARLPGYMVPSHYVPTDSIPVTRNGKVDRKALVGLTAAQVATRTHVPPRTKVEADLVEIWKSLLPVSRLGVTDDFFVVGGSSLSALQLSSRISRSFAVPMRVASIFEQRTVADQARLIAGAPATPPSALPGLRPRPRSSRHLLSFAQERIWFLHMLEPDSAAYNIRLLAKLTGVLDAGVLRQAVHSLVERHEMLRVTFGTEGGRAFQTPRTDLPVDFELRDLATEGAAAAGTVRRAVQQASARPFRLHQEPPLRVVLFRLSNSEHRLLIVLHHIAGDGWSLRLMLRELSVLYQQHLGERTATLPALAVQYIDYAEAVRDPAHQESIDRDLRYWLDRLADCPPLELPGDAPDAGPQRPASGRVSGTISPATGRKLRDLGAATRTTPFEITMSALNLVLSRLSDQQDVVVGFPVANRQGVELEGIVGLFLNVLVLRTDLSGRPSFTELLRRVSAGVRAAYEHQAAPFELLVERLNPARQLDRTPVFQVLLNYLGDLRQEVSIKDVSVEFDSDVFEVEAKYALVFYVRNRGEGMQVDLVHRPDLFSAARAQMMLRQLQLVLDQVAQAPEDPISSYSLVPPESGAVASDLDRALAEPEHPPVTELIAARAAAAPDHVAIVQGSDAITYRELVQRSEAVARYLAEQGCGPGDVIGVTGVRSVGFVVGLLGVLSSGAIALPVDPGLPEGRRQHLLAIGKPAMFVCAEDTDAASDSGTGSDRPTVRIAARTGLPRTVRPDAGSSAVLAPVSSRSPAYLFFTSGTSGAPRGVLGWHGALSHFLVWQSRSFGIRQHDRCAQTTGASFDVMLRDTLLALVSGATLVVPTASDELGGKAVFGWLGRERVTVLHATPTVLQSWLLDAPAGSRLPCLRWTFLAGEPLTAALVERFRSTCPDSGEIVNLYGPTETTLAKFAYRVPHGPLPPVLPVGSPLPQCEALVLRDDVACGVGEPGEIVIRTPFRTLGYVNDPAATDAAFFRNPRRDDARDLLYRTGDIGRFRPDGLLELVGRTDDQVKIDGVRIQPAEVESQLARHPLVSNCLVVAHPDRRDEVHLVAYVVPRTRDPMLGNQLRGYLSNLLPRAMVPGEYVVLDRIPTTPNGKPDRGALPAPLVARDGPRRSAVAPRTGAEQTVRDLWAAVLDRPALGVDDNFFELGGTSLKLLRLHALLEERFPGVFPVARLFSYPTIAGQAALVEPTDARSDYEVVEHEF